MHDVLLLPAGRQGGCRAGCWLQEEATGASSTAPSGSISSTLWQQRSALVAACTAPAAHSSWQISLARQSGRDVQLAGALPGECRWWCNLSCSRGGHVACICWASCYACTSWVCSEIRGRLTPRGVVADLLQRACHAMHLACSLAHEACRQLA